MQTLEAIGRAARGPGRLYLTGGATAVLLGWRATTVDVDLVFDPEPPGVFEAIARLKDDLEVNIELASPAHFLPELPAWAARSAHIGRFGQVDAFHYDFYAQVLAKLERDHSRDRLDVAAMRDRGLVAPERLRTLFEAIKPSLIRFPAVDAATLTQKVAAFGDTA